MRTVLYAVDGKTPLITEVSREDVIRDLLIALLGWVTGARPPRSPEEANRIMSAAVDTLGPDVVKAYLPNLGFEPVPLAQDGSN